MKMELNINIVQSCQNTKKKSNNQYSCENIKCVVSKQENKFQPLYGLVMVKMEIQIMERDTTQAFKTNIIDHSIGCYYKPD